MLREEIAEVLFSQEQIAAHVKALGRRISEDYQGKNLLMIGILKGSIIFLADLMRAVTIPARMEFMCASSYGSGQESSGHVEIRKDLDIDPAGYDLLLVEDIIDSGRTLFCLKELLKERKPNSVRIVTLLDKPDRRKINLTPDYCCFQIPDRFVVGYGLDYDEDYRNLPYIGVLKPEFI